MNKSRTGESFTEIFPEIDFGLVGLPELTAMGYIFRHVSVFDHWLTDDEASASNIITFEASVKNNAEMAYLDGERRFLDLYFSLACEGVVCNRPTHERTLFKEDKFLEDVLLKSLRERCLMDVYFKNCQARVVGGYDRTDLILVRSESDLKRICIEVQKAGLHVLN